MKKIKTTIDVIRRNSNSKTPNSCTLLHQFRQLLFDPAAKFSYDQVSLLTQTTGINQRISSFFSHKLTSTLGEGTSPLLL